MKLFVMPSLGSDMEQATLVEWLVEPGAPVRRGDLVAVVETDKGAIEIEVFETGVFGPFLVELGAEVQVGAPLAEIQVDVDEAHGSIGIESRAGQAPAVQAGLTLPQRRHRVSPVARKYAAAHQLDLDTINGSGPDGAIVLADVQGAATPDQAAQHAGQVGPAAHMRRTIAAAMARSKREIPHYYLQHTQDVQCAVDWLAQVNRDRPPRDRLLMIALFLKATALALRAHPAFNGFYEDDVFHASTSIHVGTAIAIRGGGLVAPALHDTDGLSLEALMSQLRDLTARVRAGRFRASELRDPTVTVSSLGERGVEALYGVIYPPQVACIGFGKVLLRPWALADRSVASKYTVAMTLAADHRVSDGRQGAQLLTGIGELLQAPDALLEAV